MENGFSIAMTPVQLAAVMSDESVLTERIWGREGNAASSFISLEIAEQAISKAVKATRIEVVMKKKQFNNKPYYITTDFPVI
ncbi:hypothetical protein [Erwinia rhapontici]|uniref:hypothetical protein n=1 Tax=Erwinia rhapontici TaxID=55212 RepID=UPI003B9E7182